MKQELSITRVRPTYQAWIIAALLMFVDAFVFNQGVISLFLGLGLIFIVLPRTFLPKFAGVRRMRLRNLMIYGVAILLVFALNAANNRLARNRGDVVAAKIKEFNQKYGRYPQSLQDLVPEFIERVPRAKYTALYGEFSYFKSERGALLLYTALPPFGRPTYDFTRDEWTKLD